MIPPPPGLLSRTTLWPMPSPSARPTARAMMSVLPAADEITIMRIGLLGYDRACAPAPLANAKPHTNMAARAPRARALENAQRAHDEPANILEITARSISSM